MDGLKMNVSMFLQRARTGLLCGVVGAVMSACAPLAAQTGAPACSAPEYRQFDFWVGDWDAFDVGDPTTSTAHIRVDRILDGCVLKETYEGTNGALGQSFTIYDKIRGVWHQTWVTNRGRLLTIEGKMESGAIVLNGSDRTPDGKPRLIRGTWKPEGGNVRETAIMSIDNGVTWAPWFDLIFRPHASDAQSHPKAKP
jgi:hypothetical protein